MAGIAVDYLLVWFECLGTRSGSITALATGRDRPEAALRLRRLPTSSDVWLRKNKPAPFSPKAVSGSGLSKLFKEEYA